MNAFAGTYFVPTLFIKGEPTPKGNAVDLPRSRKRICPGAHRPARLAGNKIVFVRAFLRFQDTFESVSTSISYLCENITDEPSPRTRTKITRFFRRVKLQNFLKACLYLRTGTRQIFIECSRGGGCEAILVKDEEFSFPDRK